MESACGLRSFFLGGFECSNHRLNSGKRLDLIAATQHEQFCERDYSRLSEMGILSARDGVRWPLIEKAPYQYDFGSLFPMLSAARATGMQIIWDIFHYGYPDDLDPFGAEFIERFRAFAEAVAVVITENTDGAPYFAPVNEISFFAWAAGEVGILNPFATGRGDQLKAQLVRAVIAAIDAIRSVAPAARFVQVDPIVNIVTSRGMDDATVNAARAHQEGQFVAGDMLRDAGRDYLDIVGANYYIHNQWVYGGKFIEPTDPRYRPLHDILREVYERYRRPILLAETGIEDDRRPEWLRYVCDEVIIAMQHGIPVEGICLYPILDYPGWNDDRHCCTGLWGYADGCGNRDIYSPLAEELVRQQERIEEARLCFAAS